MRIQLEGEVRSDRISRAIYSVDASIFEIQPQLIALPKHLEDCRAAVEFARETNTPIIPRGAATGTAGGCLGRGLVLDLSKYFREILEINIEERWVRVQPGVVLDELNAALKPHGFRTGPDLSTSNRATIGGMIATNAGGRFGQMMDYLKSAALLRSDGSLTYLEKEKEPVLSVVDRYREEIVHRFPKVRRFSSGYQLHTLLNDPPTIAPLIAGSEGTLGIIIEAKLKLVPLQEESPLCVLPFESVAEAMKSLPKLLQYNPTAIELIDQQIIELGRISSSMRGKTDWLKGTPGALLIVEGDLPYRPIDPQHQENVWALRKAGLSLLLSRRTHSRAIGFLEDMIVPVPRLPQFLRRFTTLLKKHGCEAGIYGHALDGCLHIRPYLDLRMQTQIDKMLKMMDEAAELLLKFEGALSGEHGDGRLRSHLEPRLFGRKLAQAFVEIKKIFDPENLMNPEVKLGKVFPREKLRSYPREDFSSQFHFQDGLPSAADRCNGNGACRNLSGTMCPSFHSTRDEYQTTRARAQAIRTALNTRRELFTTKELYDVLEHCIECKACKTECPSQIDMAKMKSEFLYHYHKANGTSLRDWVFAHVGPLSRFGKPPRWLLNKLGFAPQRPLPPFAKKRFSKRLPTQRSSSKKVVLFNDTFTEYNEPQIGLSTIRLLQQLGYEVIIPPYTCCGRPLISKGFLPKAKKYAERLIDKLIPYIKQGIPIIGLEPSCLFTLRDDYPDLIGHTLPILTLDEFLLDHPLPQTGKEVHVHLHCHQKALLGKCLPLLSRIAKPHLIQTGCCGLAGSFGYEKEHYDFSLAIGEQSLFPQVRALDPHKPLIANGFSCRQQILHACARRPLHLAEFLLK